MTDTDCGPVIEVFAFEQEDCRFEPDHGMKELSRSSVTLCLSPPRCMIGYLAIGSDGNCTVTKHCGTGNDCQALYHLVS